MQKKLHIYITIMILLLSSIALAQIDAFHKNYQSVLSKYVQDGLVDYKGLNQDSKSIILLKESIANTATIKMSHQELKTFLINAYNMTVIISIADNYSSKSVMDIDGFFDKKKHQIAEKSVTLNELERNWLFNKFPDARLHFALVCGAISCPHIKGTPFNSQNLESKLEKLAAATINDSKFVSIDMHEKTVTVSKLFDWYQTDFEKKGTVIDYINTYSDKTVPKGFSINFKIYSWKLNDQ